MKDTIPNENIVAYNIFTIGWVHLTDDFISLSQNTLPLAQFPKIWSFVI